MRPTVVPIPLGCCPHEPRCLLCPPADPPGPDTVAALVACYADEHPGQPLEVRFFGGAPPDDALIEAIGGAPFAARV
ncbi:MAG TPA: hypothetical protein PKA64_18040, partial [Myxococcota bacterium]|nr:hypothetical protein [Myxococcota bacterium]